MHPKSANGLLTDSAYQLSSVDAAKVGAFGAVQNAPEATRSVHNRMLIERDCEEWQGLLHEALPHAIDVVALMELEAVLDAEPCQPLLELHIRRHQVVPIADGDVDRAIGLQSPARTDRRRRAVKSLAICRRLSA